MVQNNGQRRELKFTVDTIWNIGETGDMHDQIAQKQYFLLRLLIYFIFKTNLNKKLLKKKELNPNIYKKNNKLHILLHSIIIKRILFLIWQKASDVLNILPHW